MPEQPVKALLNQNQSFLFNYPFMYLRHILTIIYQLMLHFKTVSEYFIMEIWHPQSMPKPDTCALGSYS